jgi:phospholipid-binding lipoprotein MlaA
MKNVWRLKWLTLVLVCAGWVLPALAQSAPPTPDPWESFNRKVFGFNEALDSTLIQPVARVYREKTPDLVRTGVSNFFGNLRDLWSAINSALQAKPGPTLDNAGRFVINTTLGIYGLFDVATHMGLERHTEDFGQTLGRWGVPTGPYVVLPLFGPSTVRDGIGLIPDSRGNLINQVDDVSERNVLWVSNLIDRRAQLLPLTDQADRIALDKYTFTRDAYLQKRLNDVYDGDPPETADPTEVDSGADAPKSNP